MYNLRLVTLPLDVQLCSRSVLGSFSQPVMNISKTGITPASKGVHHLLDGVGELKLCQYHAGCESKKTYTEGIRELFENLPLFLCQSQVLEITSWSFEEGIDGLNDSD